MHAVLPTAVSQPPPPPPQGGRVDVLACMAPCPPRTLPAPTEPTHPTGAGTSSPGNTASPFTLDAESLDLANLPAPQPAAERSNAPCLCKTAQAGDFSPVCWRFHPGSTRKDGNRPASSHQPCTGAQTCSPAGDGHPVKPPTRPGLVQTFYFPSARAAQPAWGWLCPLEAKLGGPPRPPSPPSSWPGAVAPRGWGELPWPGQHHRLQRALH